jgi:hypothetical protein
MIYEWLARKMVERNARLIRSGLSHRWWFVAFWISFAAFAITEWKSLEIITGVLLACAFVARILARRRALAEMEKFIKEKGEHDVKPL